MLGASTPLGCLGLGDDDDNDIRGLVGTYTNTSVGVTYTDAFAILKRFVTNTFDDTYICNVYIYSSEQAYLYDYIPIGYENNEILMSSVIQTEGIVNALYYELLKLTQFTGFVPV